MWRELAKKLRSVSRTDPGRPRTHRSGTATKMQARKWKQKDEGAFALAQGIRVATGQRGLDGAIDGAGYTLYR